MFQHVGGQMNKGRILNVIQGPVTGDLQPALMLRYLQGLRLLLPQRAIFQSLWSQQATILIPARHQNGRAAHNITSFLTPPLRHAYGPGELTIGLGDSGLAYASNQPC